MPIKQSAGPSITSATKLRTEAEIKGISSHRTPPLTESYICYTTLCFSVKPKNHISFIVCVSVSVFKVRE